MPLTTRYSLIAGPPPKRPRPNQQLRSNLCAHMQQGGGVSCAVSGETPASHSAGLLGLTINPSGGEPPAERIGRLVCESPVVIFARRGCCMCHAMRRLLAAVGAYATVIELDEAAEEAAASTAAAATVPALFVGGLPVGGLDGLMVLHLSGHLVPCLREVGAICG